MRNEKIILKQNSLSSGIIIKLGLRVAFVVVCVWLIYRMGTSVASVVGIYILVRSVLKIIRLSVRVICSLLSILFLIILISLTSLLIF
ncbi:MAG: hypothetical protein LBT43_22870 [Prevotella sp.]|jgi:hypothetical protein|nr:hypothetical protein [Prevotella sp.]